MMYTSFQRLAALLRPNNNAACGKKGTTRFCWNGQISDVQLACAIRWFAGGLTYDIIPTYGIGHTNTMNSVWYVVDTINTMNSVWYVVDTINRHPCFTIVNPDSRDHQRSIAKGFATVLGTGFKCCAGAVDGILIWIQKPLPTECQVMGAIWENSCVGERRSKG